METLYIIVPCYNEEEALKDSSKEFKNKINQLIKSKKISKDSKVLFIDDGSLDKTWNIIKDLSNRDSIYKGIKLSKNKGHQNALLAGLEYVGDKCDMCISIDADLQDDIDAIDKMVDDYYKGYEIVYGVRDSRENDGFLKRFTAQFFYKLMNVLGANTIYNHADYRLLSKKALTYLLEYKESNLFIRGVVREIGLNSSIVYYERNKRIAGKSKYSLKKMFNLAMNGVTSFSVKPLSIITLFGFIVSIFSFMIMVYTLIVKFTGHTVPGWTFITISIWLIGGIQMLFLGILGEYIGKIYSEVKNRPKYFIERTTDDEK